MLANELMVQTNHGITFPVVGVADLNRKTEPPCGCTKQPDAPEIQRQTKRAATVANTPDGAQVGDLATGDATPRNR
ncbi:hypothetical protein [Crateriforma spongiae]|uniref:hypothetical protein n=1 Tax=Crateriforma spongiae TaxID=2724528 RepID=UPI001445860E|nr:hypothetical protein [Crateriforma spongiae]